MPHLVYTVVAPFKSLSSFVCLLLLLNQSFPLSFPRVVSCCMCCCFTLLNVIESAHSDFATNITCFIAQVEKFDLNKDINFDKWLGNTMYLNQTVRDEWRKDEATSV